MLTLYFTHYFVGTCFIELKTFNISKLHEVLKRFLTSVADTPAFFKILLLSIRHAQNFSEFSGF